MKIKCPNPECNHEWETKSKLIFVTCPSCQKKFKKDKEAKSLSE